MRKFGHNDYIARKADLQRLIKQADDTIAEKAHAVVVGHGDKTDVDAARVARKELQESLSDLDAAWAKQVEHEATAAADEDAKARRSKMEDLDAALARKTAGAAMLMDADALAREGSAEIAAANREIVGAVWSYLRADQPHISRSDLIGWEAYESQLMNVQLNFSGFPAGRTAAEFVEAQNARTRGKASEILHSDDNEDEAEAA